MPEQRSKLIYILVILAMFTTFNTSATSIEVSLTETKVRWENAIDSDGGGKVPITWTVHDSLPPTQKWVPGSNNRIPPTTIELSNGVDSITVPINFMGWEYALDGVFDESSHSSGSVCNPPIINANSILVKGVVPCFSPTALEQAISRSPYAKVRPIFRIVDQDLMSAFEGKEPGFYEGAVSIGNVYDFYTKGNIRTRMYKDQLFKLKVNYELDDNLTITKTGNGRIEPRYLLDEDKVFGSTLWRVVVNGNVDNGIKLTLSDPFKRFEMSHQGGTDKFPYGLYCDGCATPILVSDDGVIRNETTEVASSTPNMASFNLTARYSTTLSSRTTGKYLDSFKVLIEPKI